MKNIVTVGGGTGSYTVLSGLKNLKNVSLTALVSMADDGGSTGVLRKKWKVMPAGDVRQCLAALSGKEFLNNRYTWGPLKNHKIGNVFLGVLEKITGDFNTGLKILSFLLNAKGKIVPVTLDYATLCAETMDGKIITGEDKIDTQNFQANNGKNTLKRIFYKEEVKLNPDAKRAILGAGYIVLGPGNLYCSIIPNFITEGFREAIKRSPAKIILMRNLVNRQNHTMGWGTKEHVAIIEKYLGRRVDVILINKEEFSVLQKERYMKDGGEQIFILEDLEDPRIIRSDLLSSMIFIQSKDDEVKRSLIRHDSDKLASVIDRIIN